MVFECTNDVVGTTRKGFILVAIDAGFGAEAGFVDVVSRFTPPVFLGGAIVFGFNGGPEAPGYLTRLKVDLLHKSVN